MNKQTNFLIYITNCDKSTKNRKSQWLALPCTKEELRNVLTTIGLKDCNNINKWFISNINIDIEFLWDLNLIKENSNIEQLNYLAILLNKLSDDVIKKLSAVLSIENATDIIDVINLIFNLDKYDYCSDIRNEYDLGYRIVYDYNVCNTCDLKNLRKYIDYTRLGRDVVISEANSEFTPYGYIKREESIKEIYTGEVPQEYKIY